MTRHFYSVEFLVQSPLNFSLPLTACVGGWVGCIGGPAPPRGGDGGGCGVVFCEGDKEPPAPIVCLGQIQMNSVLLHAGEKAG